MNKLITVISFVLLAVAYAEANGDVYGSNNHGNFATHTDDYITLNNIQYKSILDRFDSKLQEFEESYLERLGTVTISQEFVVKSVVSAVEHWDPMLVLGDYTKKCILKYRYNIPKVDVTRTAITKCHEDYSEQLSVLLDAAFKTRNVLVGYIENYDMEVEKCGTDFAKSEEQYSVCITTLTGKTNNLVISNEKTFQIQLEAAECTAKANVKSAIDCSYTVNVRTLTIVAETQVQIENCILHKDECKPCEDNTCTESFDLHGSVQNETFIYNPFFERSDNPRCIMLNVEY